MITNENAIKKIEVVKQTEVASATSVQAFSRGLDLNVLTQFKANLAQVEDLNLRLKYVLGEVQYLLKKK